ncbi:MAG TPA: energy transducer TonB [Candidatus Acidoferrales bacterium]|nr:energy transducer TonB [Candidatus Acidoferrales bacterium]
MAPNNASPGAEPVQTPQTSGTDKNRTGFPSSQGAITPLGTVAIRSHFDSVRNAPAPDPDSSGSTLQIGQLTSIRQPVYPPEAARRRIEGTVRLQAVVAENGVVETVKLLSGPPGLVASAINAVQDWRYGPTFLDGHPIESMEDVTVEFRLANSTPSPR